MILFHLKLVRAFLTHCHSQLMRMSGEKRSILTNPLFLNLNDVAYWPSGKAICLFFGPTPIGKKGEIKPYSPVNVVGKITDPDKSILENFTDGTKISFRENS